MGNCSSSPSEATKTVEAMEDVSVKKKTLDSAATFTPALPHSPDETVVSVPAATLASETPDAAVQAVMPTEALASEDSGSGPESDPHGIVDASAVADLRGFDAASAAAAYVKCMGKHMFGPADLSSDAALMSMASGQTISAATMRRVHKELRELQHNLPCTPSSSILIRYDKARPQFMKALITGPEDTPYDCGAFVFDICIPEGYPASPPYVLLRTTGGGSVRFNPNLYNCGKVCLSLLGTWSGSHPCEQWSSSSTLLQVLVSIQGLILVAHPYYNEPGRGYDPGESAKRLHHVKFESNGGFHVVRKSTLRWAIMDAAKNPIPPFQEATREHLRLRRDRINLLLEQWQRECALPDEPKLDEAQVAEMRELATQVSAHLDEHLPAAPADAATAVPSRRDSGDSALAAAGGSVELASETPPHDVTVSSIEYSPAIESHDLKCKADVSVPAVDDEAGSKPEAVPAEELCRVLEYSVD